MVHPEPVEFGRHHRVLVGRCRHGEVDAEGLAWAGGRARRCVTVWVVWVYKRFEKQTKIVFFTANTDPMKFLPTDLTGLYVEKKKGARGRTLTVGDTWDAGFGDQFGRRTPVWSRHTCFRREDDLATVSCHTYTHIRIYTNMHIITTGLID